MTAIEAGQKLLTSQTFEIRSVVAQDDSVGVEASRVRKLAMPLGMLSAGAEMKAELAMFFQLRDGRIVSQRNYDCFYPW